jgi:hypothetical protein
MLRIRLASWLAGRFSSGSIDWPAYRRVGRRPRVNARVRSRHHPPSRSSPIDLGWVSPALPARVSSRSGLVLMPARSATRHCTPPRGRANTTHAVDRVTLVPGPSPILGVRSRDTCTGRNVIDRLDLIGGAHGARAGQVGPVDDVAEIMRMRAMCPASASATKTPSKLSPKRPPRTLDQRSSAPRRPRASPARRSVSP